MNVNSAQVTSALRTVLGWLGIWLMARGYVDESAWTTLSSAVLGLVSAGLVIGTFVYGLWVRRTSALVKTVADLPEVSKVVTTEAIAAKVDRANVDTK